MSGSSAEGETRSSVPNVHCAVGHEVHATFEPGNRQWVIPGTCPACSLLAEPVVAPASAEGETSRGYCKCEHHVSEHGHRPGNRAGCAALMNGVDSSEGHCECRAFVAASEPEGETPPEAMAGSVPELIPGAHFADCWRWHLACAVTRIETMAAERTELVAALHKTQAYLAEPVAPGYVTAARATLSSAVTAAKLAARPTGAEP